jgi:hypothetical protein
MALFHTSPPTHTRRQALPHNYERASRLEDKQNHRLSFFFRSSLSRGRIVPDVEQALSHTNTPSSSHTHADTSLPSLPPSGPVPRPAVKFLSPPCPFGPVPNNCLNLFALLGRLTRGGPSTSTEDNGASKRERRQPSLQTKYPPPQRSECEAKSSVRCWLCGLAGSTWISGGSAWHSFAQAGRGQRAP